MSSETIRRPMDASYATSEDLHKTSILIIFLALMANLVFVRLVVERFYPDTFRSPSQSAVFGWMAIGIWTAAGLIGVAA